MGDPAAPPATAKAKSQARHRRPAIAAFVAGMVVLAFNLRGAITSLPPLFPELSSSLHLSSAEIAVLAATPVVCFGLFSGVAAARRGTCAAGGPGPARRGPAVPGGAARLAALPRHGAGVGGHRADERAA